LKRLGICLKKARKERDFTQEQLSQLSGVSVRHIAKIEKGVMNPSFEVLCHLALVLGISIETIICQVTSNEDTELLEAIDLYRACPQKRRPLVKATLLALVNGLREDLVLPEDDALKVPQFAIK